MPCLNSQTPPPVARPTATASASKIVFSDGGQRPGHQRRQLNRLILFNGFDLEGKLTGGRIDPDFVADLAA